MPVRYTAAMGSSVFLSALIFLAFYVSAIPQTKGLIGTPLGPGKLVYRLYGRGSSFLTPTEVCSGSCQDLHRLAIKKPIKVLVHGWLGHSQSLLHKELVNGYLKNFDYNVITVDWSTMGSMEAMYPKARSSVPEVASALANFLNSLIARRGVRPENVHIIGHSLGAHIAGLAGYQINSSKIGRITGLDPAGPLFSVGVPKGRLSTDSARFVDVIHTSPLSFGIGSAIGHVDFYPNGPLVLQPGCGMSTVSGLCGHMRCIHYYAESLLRSKAFPAVPCVDWSRFLTKQCDMKRVVHMGELTPPTARGKYFLTTNSNSPYGKGSI